MAGKAGSQSPLSKLPQLDEQLPLPFRLVSVQCGRRRPIRASRRRPHRFRTRGSTRNVARRRYTPVAWARHPCHMGAWGVYPRCRMGATPFGQVYGHQRGPARHVFDGHESAFRELLQHPLDVSPGQPTACRQTTRRQMGRAVLARGGRDRQKNAPRPRWQPGFCQRGREA